MTKDKDKKKKEKQLTREEVIEACEGLISKIKDVKERQIARIRFFAGQPATRKEAMFMLAEYFLSEYNILTLSDTDEIFIYKEGIYLGNGDKPLAKQSQRILKNLLDKNFLNETIAHVKRTTYKKRDDVVEDNKKICLENGILNVKTLKIEEHNPNIIFFNKLPVKYDSKADCLKIKTFLSEVVNQEDIEVLQEFIGYCLYKEYHIHKTFMLVGGGSNGKSTFINLLKKFLGQDSCSSVPLHQLETDKFAVANLFSKLANMFADLPSRALKESSMFKMLCGEDLISGEKKFKDKFQFTNYAKMIFSANQIPKTPDDSDAFFRRWIIINFPNQFLNSKADKRLINKLTTTDELSGLLNFALEGLKRLLRQADFSHTESIDKIRETYIRQSDSVEAFKMDNILIKPDKFEKKKELYTAYCDYCRTMNYPIVPENTFHKELQAKVRVEDYRPKLDGVRVQCWRGIKLDINGNLP